MPNHYLNQWWLLINHTPKDRLEKNIKSVFIDKFVFKGIVSNFATILCSVDLVTYMACGKQSSHMSARIILKNEYFFISISIYHQFVARDPILYVDIIFMAIFLLGCKWQWVIIGAGNGLAPNRWQTLPEPVMTQITDTFMLHQTLYLIHEPEFWRADELQTTCLVFLSPGVWITHWIRWLMLWPSLQPSCFTFSFPQNTIPW